MKTQKVLDVQLKQWGFFYLLQHICFPLHPLHPLARGGLHCTLYTVGPTARGGNVQARRRRARLVPQKAARRGEMPDTGVVDPPTGPATLVPSYKKKAALPTPQIALQHMPTF